MSERDPKQRFAAMPEEEARRFFLALALSYTGSDESKAQAIELGLELVKAHPGLLVVPPHQPKSNIVVVFAAQLRILLGDEAPPLFLSEFSHNEFNQRLKRTFDQLFQRKETKPS